MSGATPSGQHKGREHNLYSRLCLIAKIEAAININYTSQRIALGGTVNHCAVSSILTPLWCWYE